MTVPTHHPGDTLLIDYAGGALGEAASLIVATHLALCPCCRLNVAEMEAVGGALLESIEPEEVDPACLETVLARLDDLPPLPRVPRPKLVCQPAEVPLLPEPLRRYIGGDLSRLPWKRLMRGMDCYDIPLGSGSGYDSERRGKARLMRLASGVGPPHHTHRGIELTLVLDGGFTDDLGQFARGDLSVADDSVRHRPVADEEGCLCLAVTDAPLRFTGALGLILNPFVTF
ncbi:ChrR-like anti-ECFsigma factor [Azospirillum brasilense]|uniref:ChrR-like anti-ECFsigma factor n=1 Tax=Azospirillum brasilense TaxID=192 RepID=A0A560CHY7_AZOBR|nr:ChrR family anti-sigma-E factor [Azospirillum brasilense]TWA84476.1 ChrR-like anti-ECFsigma factor [Azospirillum brasilense]